MTDAPAATPQLKALARSYYLANAAANAAKLAADKERKELFQKLEDAGLEAFGFGTTDAEGRPLRLEVAVETPEREVIDVERLRPLVSEEQFLAIVSATKKSVEEHAGRAIAMQAARKEPGTRNVTVKPAK